MPILRKSFFVNPKLQFKSLFMALLLTLITAAIVYATLSHVLFSSDRLMELSNFEIESLQNSLRFALIWIVLILLVVFGLENILRFHRFVGPLFVVEKMVHAFGSGDFSQDFKLRKDDELKGIVNELLEMRNRLKIFIENDRKICKEIDEKIVQIAGSVSQGFPQDKIAKELEEMQRLLHSVSSHYKI